MAIYLLDELVNARRTRDAVRQIKALPVPDRTKKSLMAEWFQEHDRAAPEREQRFRAYNDLLGQERNARQIG